MTTAMILAKGPRKVVSARMATPSIRGRRRRPISATAAQAPRAAQAGRSRPTANPRPQQRPEAAAAAAALSNRSSSAARQGDEGRAQTAPSTAVQRRQVHGPAMRSNTPSIAPGRRDPDHISRLALRRRQAANCRSTEKIDSLAFELQAQALPSSAKMCLLFQLGKKVKKLFEAKGSGRIK